MTESHPAEVHATKYAPANQPGDDGATRKSPVMEIFGPTIQGEGAMIGEKTMFIRMGGCDYKCAKCDSMHAVDPLAVKTHARWMTQMEMAAELYKTAFETGTQWVTISGGNPAIWDLSILVNNLHASGLKVAVETQATVFRNWIAWCDQITLSPKSPGMGEKFIPEVYTDFLRAVVKEKDEVNGVSLKVVIFDQRDLEFALEVGKLSQFYIYDTELYLSLGNPYPPVLGPDLKLHDQEVGESLPDTLLNQYAVLLEDYLQDVRFRSWKFLPQLHVLVWGNKTGV